MAKRHGPFATFRPTYLEKRNETRYLSQRFTLYFASLYLTALLFEKFTTIDRRIRTRQSAFEV